jgi:hypothetical protein
LRNLHLRTRVWCVTATVVVNGPGTRHFTSGSNVYCFPVAADHGIVKVIGQHRTTQRYLTVFVNADVLGNWQVMALNAPDVIREFGDEWDGSEASRVRAERLVAYLRSRYN